MHWQDNPILLDAELMLSIFIMMDVCQSSIGQSNIFPQGARSC